MTEVIIDRAAVCSTELVDPAAIAASDAQIVARVVEVEQLAAQR